MSARRHGLASDAAGHQRTGRASRHRPGWRVTAVSGRLISNSLVFVLRTPG